MLLQIDFNSDEAIYIQLRNQIIIGIATESIKEGDPLPSLRQMADNIGINMHTVNKAYSVLKQEGFVKLDPVSYTHLDVYKRQVEGDVAVKAGSVDGKKIPVIDAASIQWKK